jgi:hypothetical protein
VCASRNEIANAKVPGYSRLQLSLATATRPDAMTLQNCPRVMDPTGCPGCSPRASPSPTDPKRGNRAAINSSNSPSDVPLPGPTRGVGKIALTKRQQPRTNQKMQRCGERRAVRAYILDPESDLPAKSGGGSVYVSRGPCLPYVLVRVSHEPVARLPATRSIPRRCSTSCVRKVTNPCLGLTSIWKNSPPTWRLASCACDLQAGLVQAGLVRVPVMTSNSVFLAPS